MLPIPAIPFWSSRNDFSGTVRPSAIRPISSAVSRSVERLDPDPRVEVGLELSGRQQRGVTEAARIGELAAAGRRRARARPAGRRARSAPGRAGPPPNRRALLAALGEQQVAGHPQVHDQRRAVVEPDQQVLAAATDRCDPAAERAPPRSARSAPAASSAHRGSATATIVRPTSSGSIWRRIVSTSGSSGIRVEVRTSPRARNDASCSVPHPPPALTGRPRRAQAFARGWASK